ncbi:hypothetical protein KIM67_03525 [Flagellimonas sp. 389]|uniref:DUF6122 family protein n=1 Tax=Flagellimonas sp. 389 TaxID=2835862 RepID=UPI001BD35FD9|nr:DUF6122 family protein [Flagellimonas sp. 389]MBS9461466.1 hypothetical protein [Flagellimonas sp. 389]
MPRFIVHYGIHFIVPLLIGLLLVKEDKLKVTLILLAGILIDIDHIIAEPIFDADRCSIGFHPLHSVWAILLYCLLPFFKKTRIIGLALIIHIIADSADCLLM